MAKVTTTNTTNTKVIRSVMCADIVDITVLMPTQKHTLINTILIGMILIESGI